MAINDTFNPVYIIKYWIQLFCQKLVGFPDNLIYFLTGFRKKYYFKLITKRIAYSIVGFGSKLYIKNHKICFLLSLFIKKTRGSDEP